MILEIIIVILGILVVVLGFTTFNLLQKNEKAEDIIVSQGEFINKMEEHISYSDKRLKQIDEKGMFPSHDLLSKVIFTLFSSFSYHYKLDCLN